MEPQGRTSPGPSAESPHNGNGHGRIPDGDGANPASVAAQRAAALIAEIKAYAAHFVSAKIDGIKARTRRLAAYAVLGLIGLFTGIGVLFSAAFLLLAGIANGLGALFGGRIWLGQILVGLLVLAAAGLAAWIAVGKFTEASRKQTEQKYEGKRNQQRVDFGHDIHERAGGK